jgi:uncharacterized protein (TIGR01777 family)
MSMARVQYRSRIEAPAEEVFRWHTRPGALERLTPPWAPIEVVERRGGIETGGRVVLRLPLGPTRVRWVAEHVDYVDGHQFRDVQIEGPFAHWAHTHRVEPDGSDACVLEDSIEYTLPLGSVGALLGGPMVRRMLERNFAYRHRLTADDVRTHRRYSGPPLHWLCSGSSGLIGAALVPFLTAAGHRVTPLVRAKTAAGSVRWDPSSGSVEFGRLDRVDAVVHLAGENIAGGRWTEQAKKRIRDSRTVATRKLCETLARVPQPPQVLVCASAIGYYGDTGTQAVHEGSPSGRGFLASTCREWEAATEPAVQAGIRVVNLRLGVVLSAAGGALAKLLLPFRAGAGGCVGSGEQYFSWVAVDDVLGAILHAVRTDTLRGPINVVAPHAVTNYEFTKTLGRVLSRPTLLPLPAAAARLLFGEMADEMLLASTHVRPAQLERTGYSFRFAEIEDALRYTLGRQLPL